MPSDRDIEQFIGDSFTSIWDLELLSILVEDSARPMTADELVERMRGSDQVVAQGIRALSAAGIATVDDKGRVRFSPVSDAAEAGARQAVVFYQRFPGRARRLMIQRQAPGLSAFASAFRLRKDEP